MARRIALFGGSFNPPGTHHREIAEMLARHFDEVRIVPCGPRPDKPLVGEMPSIFRAALCSVSSLCTVATPRAMMSWIIVIAVSVG